MLSANPVDCIIHNRSAFDPHILGRLAAWRAAGSWPSSGTLAMYAQAVARADDAVAFVRRLEARWHCRWRLWAHRDKYEAIGAPLLDRLRFRLAAAREISDARTATLARLLGESAGTC